MGRELKTITISASVSRHNSEQDRYDDAFMERLREEIDAAVARARSAMPHTSTGFVDVSGP